MKNMIKKIILAVSAAALVFAAFPSTSVLAADEAPPASNEASNERLEKIWSRQLRAYERLGRAFENPESHLAKLQARIDKAAENGKDVTTLQAALDDYAAALTAAKPAYDSIGGIVGSHAGFDSDGKVTDADQARSTVEQMREKMMEVRSAVGDSFKALHEALKAFRDANKLAEPKDERD